MAAYKKGADAERKLIQMLFEKGFAVARVAGSGASSLPCPDILAMSKRASYAIECKAVAGNYLNIEHRQLDELAAWARKAGIKFLVAWKVPREGWFFLSRKNFKKNPRHYAVKKDEAILKGLGIEGL